MRDAALERFEALFGLEFGHGKPFDLAPLKRALDELVWPRGSLPPVVHVAGTNGKGSTIAFMRAIAKAAELKVHAFTKPHLFSLVERFTVASEPVSEEALIDAAERVFAVAPDLSQFDAQVAAALLLFVETPADLALIETGMGGRDDSTNVIERPALCVITSIGLDHQDALGQSLEDIAAHKAGILKPGVDAICGRMDERAFHVIESAAQRCSAKIMRHGLDWDAFEQKGRLIVQTESRALDLPLPRMRGLHQIDNAGLAVTAMLRWRDFGDSEIASGITNARLPARLQPLTRGPLSAPIREQGGEVWVDGAHNAHAAAGLALALADLQRARPRQTTAIVGLRARKDARAFVEALAPSIERLIAVPLSEEPIAPQEVARIAAELGVESEAASSLEAAMQNAAHFHAPRVLICGSLLLAAEALAKEGG